MCSLVLLIEIDSPDLYRQERLFEFRTPPPTPQLPFSPSSLPGQQIREPHQAVFQALLLEAASEGPLVVLNASRIRCEAIIITSERIKPVPLPKASNQDLCNWVTIIGTSGIEHSSRLQECLAWLWEVIASPVLDVLDFKQTPTNDSPWPRLWWIPTGLLSQLPIHAAGRHDRPGQSVLDRVVSSYSRSIAALIKARRDTSNQKTNLGEKLLISMKETPGLSDLQYASEEIKVVANSWKRSQLCRPAKMECLECPTKTDILAGLQNCDLFHFAGHGISSPIDPLKSCLALKDWRENPLTVENLLSLESRRQKPPFLAYLSACSTGQNLARDLQDESINLMAAFQLVGFRHTVGFLWEMSDALLVEVAKAFYVELREAETARDADVAWSVHTVSRHLRDRSLRSGTDDGSWAAFTHLGP
jgi:hypothetical protein